MAAPFNKHPRVAQNVARILEEIFNFGNCVGEILPVFSWNKLRLVEVDLQYSDSLVSLRFPSIQPLY